jgi:hypothetical protein
MKLPREELDSNCIIFIVRANFRESISSGRAYIKSIYDYEN